MTKPSENSVTRCDHDFQQKCTDLVGRYGLQLTLVTDGNEIPGSFWGDSEAGLIGSQVYVRSDTPLHSVLHEASHYICMDERRRKELHTDAGGDYAEEDAVCYLQILLADHLSGYDRHSAMSDMDAWGYTFRLGSADAWFHEDASDASDWLMRHAIIDAAEQPTWQCNGQPD